MSCFRKNGWIYGGNILSRRLLGMVSPQTWKNLTAPAGTIKIPSDVLQIDRRIIVYL